MAEYKSYINALKQCAKEHENELVSFAHIRTTDLCNDTANLLETLETESDNSIPLEKIDKAIEEIQKLRGCSCSCSDGIIDDVEDILDKLIESEENK